MSRSLGAVLDIRVFLWNNLKWHMYLKAQINHDIEQVLWDYRHVSRVFTLKMMQADIYIYITWNARTLQCHWQCPRARGFIPKWLAGCLLLSTCWPQILLQSSSIQITQIECSLCGPGLGLSKLENSIVFWCFWKGFFTFFVSMTPSFMNIMSSSLVTNY